MKRVLLFVATNLAVMLILSIVLSILMPALGLSASSNAGLLLFSAVFGFHNTPGALTGPQAASRRGRREPEPGREAVCTIPTDVFSTLPETRISATCGFYRQGAGIWAPPNGRWTNV